MLASSPENIIQAAADRRRDRPRKSQHVFTFLTLTAKRFGPDPHPEIKRQVTEE